MHEIFELQLSESVYKFFENAEKIKKLWDRRVASISFKNQSLITTGQVRNCRNSAESR